MFGLCTVLQMPSTDDVEMNAAEMRSKSRVDDFQPRSATQQLEEKTPVPSQLAGTLEHIVGQLDILTQVNRPTYLFGLSKDQGC